MNDALYMRIKKICDDNGIKVTKLEQELGWGRGSIGKMRSAKKMPSIERLQEIADYFNIPLSDIVEEKPKIPVEFPLMGERKEFNVDIFTGVQGIDIKKKIPVLGHVAAGIPINAVENIIDWEEISGVMALRGEYFGLRIQGDSMEPRMCNEDTVIVRQQPDAESGDFVIALVNGDSAVCKKLKKYEDGSLALISLNSAYSPMFFSASEVAELPVQILGKVVELRAKF